MGIGTIISTIEGPSPAGFSFVINKDKGPIPIKKDQFVTVSTPEGVLVGIVINIRKTNRYFSRAESVKEYESQGSSLNDIFPIDQWEFLVADVKSLGILTKKRILRSTFPPSPGSDVFLANTEILETFLGVDKNGLQIGTIMHHNSPLKINLTRLLQKHVAILALSGAGKSYLTSVIIEELLMRDPNLGRIALVIFDSHGEYISFGEPPNASEYLDFSGRVTVIDASDIKIACADISAYQICELLPKITPPQRRELERIISNLQQRRLTEKIPYDFKDICDEIIESPGIKENTRHALVSWLEILDSTGLFSKYPSPIISKLLLPGHAIIFDLSKRSSLWEKQIIVTIFSRMLFKLRRLGLSPPYLEIIEEAHNFAPEGTRQENAISRKIIETLAREGRKFYASLCLISQRPIQLSTTTLSQCNTHIILRVTNPYDLDHIGKSSEGITRETLNSISSLRVGEALIVGEAVNHPVFVQIRKRKTQETKHALKLEDAAKFYETELKDKLDDLAAFA